MHFFLPSLVAMFLLSACSSAPPKMLTPFDPYAYKPYMQEGTASIRGRAFVKDPSRGEITSEKLQVELIPFTPYTQERFNRATLNNESLEPRHPRIEAEFSRITYTDRYGRFEFKNLPAGKYIAYCEIRWEDKYRRYITTTYSVVTVNKGETVQTVVTR